MLRFEYIVLLTLRYLNVGKFTTLTSLSSLVLCKLSFPVVGNFSNTRSDFVIEAVLRIINFSLCLGMNVQNNDVAPLTTKYYV
jgi:hypothetical protein